MPRFTPLTPDLIAQHRKEIRRYKRHLFIHNLKHPTTVVCAIFLVLFVLYCLFLLPY